jgi:hypothetical protein
MKANAQQAEAAAAAIDNSQEPSQKDAKPKEEGVSWGISMDEVDDEHSTQNTNKTLPMDMQVPEKHRTQFERLNALKYKLSNLETEDGRIRRKGELTEGQERQLHRNAEREETLKKSIVDLEEELHDKIYPEKAGNKKTVVGTQKMDDDEDDFFDRTKQRDDNGIGDEESEKTLVAKWTNLYQQQKHRNERILPQAQSHASSLTAKLAKLQASGDEEAFFVQNDLQLAKETLEKNLGEQKKAQETMKEIEYLLKIVNPKLNVDRDSGYIGEGPPPQVKEEPPKEDSTMTMLPPPIRPKPVKTREEVNDDAGHLSMPPPMARKPPTSSSPIESDDKNHSLMPPPKRKRVVGPSMPPPSSSSSSITRSTDSLPKTTSDKKPQGTLAFLATMTKQKGGKSSGSPEAKSSKPTVSKAVVDPKKDEWRAPEGQDGSGATKLNAKFAGRY